jgi:hypothetical protein
VPDFRMLWKRIALMRFAPFPTINSDLSNAAVPRRQSRHEVGVPNAKRPPMTQRDLAPEHANLNEGCELQHGGTPRTPPARGPAVAETKLELLLFFNVAGSRTSELTRNGTN